VRSEIGRETAQGGPPEQVLEETRCHACLSITDGRRVIVTGDDESSGSGVRVAVRTAVTADLPIEVVADEAAAKALVPRGKKPDDEHLRPMAKRFVDMHQLLGLDVKGLKQIVIAAERLPGSLELFQPDTVLWDRLLAEDPTAGDPAAGRMQRMQLWICGESTVCQCSYCIPITVGVSRP
jgi:hypothetical protein